MAKFRKKPIIVDAEQFVVPPGSRGVGVSVPRGMKLWPDERGFQPRDMSWGYVTTIHGQRAHVQSGDWIIAEPDGVHFYPCKPEVFAATYDPVEG